MAKRFYQIAYELGVGPRALIKQLSSLGLSVGNQMVVVQPALEERIRTLYDQLNPVQESDTAVAVEEAPRPEGDGGPLPDTTVSAPDYEAASLATDTRPTGHAEAVRIPSAPTPSTPAEIAEVVAAAEKAAAASRPEAPPPATAAPPATGTANGSVAAAPEARATPIEAPQASAASLVAETPATEKAPPESKSGVRAGAKPTKPADSAPASAAEARPATGPAPAPTPKPAPGAARPVGGPAAPAARPTPGARPAATPGAGEKRPAAAAPSGAAAGPAASQGTVPGQVRPGQVGPTPSGTGHVGAGPIGTTPPPKPKPIPPAIGYQGMAPSVKGQPPKPRLSGDLIPTIDPRAGRLLREAPKAPIPGVTAPRPTRGPATPATPSLNPSLPKSEPAPGARRDGRSRGGEPVRGAERHGKQTFQLRQRKRSSSKAPEIADAAPKSFEVTPPIPVKQFSEISGIKVSDVVKTMLLKHKQVVTPNSMLDEGTLVILALEFDRDIKFVKQVTAEDTMLGEAQIESKPEDLVLRPPVVVVMGHVDHGKTSLLDYIRKEDVAAHEAGGITQHIGAYQVKLGDGKRLTFFDTPGHEAFTEMRRRGAKVTDIVVLVVAADDGVMPQTVEAIDHAKAAEVPIVVAVTKADRVGWKPEAIERVKQQLSQHGILVSGWGGDVECFPVCSTGPQAGKGVDKLLEHLGLVAEVEDLRSDPKRNATGTVIEAENNPGRGVLATLLVQQGTLRRGDAMVAGRVWGRVRAMRDDKGALLEEAPPGTPIEVTGLDEVPEVGKPFFVRPDANEAREIAEQVRGRDRELELAAQAKPTNLEGLFSAIEQGKVKSLKIILKTDVQGSLEAIKARLDSLGNAEVKVQVIRAGVGAVSESDVTMAATYGALVVGFHVVADETARVKAKHLGVEIRMYRIIYELEDELRAMLEGKLAPESRETVLGHAEILQIFSSTKLGKIAGCRVRDGVIKRDASVRLARDGKVVWQGKLGSLRREKDDAREVKEGFECGIRLEGYDDIKDGDVIEAFQVEQVARTLAGS